MPIFSNSGPFAQCAMSAAPSTQHGISKHTEGPGLRLAVTTSLHLPSRVSKATVLQTSRLASLLRPACQSRRHPGPELRSRSVPTPACQGFEITVILLDNLCCVPCLAMPPYQDSLGIAGSAGIILCPL